MYEFKTIVEVEYDGTEGRSAYRSTAELRWDLELEVRGWGIKSFIISIPEQEVTFHVNIPDNEFDETREITLKIEDCEIDTSSCKIGIAVIMPHKLEGYKNKWTLIF